MEIKCLHCSFSKEVDTSVFSRQKLAAKCPICNNTFTLDLTTKLDQSSNRSPLPANQIQPSTVERMLEFTRPDHSGALIKISHICGLDGLRAISVIVVMLYHSHLRFMLGGYLGVEIFFVISGFLITSILLSEAARSNGRIDLIRFWKRRVLRLFPALMVLLYIITLFSAFLLKDKASQFRFDIVASSFYVENWYQIYSGGSYFADQGLPLLRHIWSLAVEEQFYFVWPLLVAGIILISQGNRKPLIYFTILLFICSSSLMVILSLSGVQSNVTFLESLNRVYLGTDTRAAGILLGALFAMTNWSRQLTGWRGRLLATLALISFGCLLLLCSVLDAQSPFLFRGGLLLVDVLTVIVIAALVMVESCSLKLILGNKVLEYIGQRSYGIYLWHWPVFRLIGYEQSGTEWILLRFLVTFVAAEISFRYIETPIRRGALQDWFSQIDCSALRFRGVFSLAVCYIYVTLLSWSGVVLAMQPPYVDEVAESLKANVLALDSTTTPCAVTSQSQNRVKDTTASKIVHKRNEQKFNYPEINGPITEAIKVTAIGDSVMKGAAIALKENAKSCMGKDRIFIDAQECRSFEKAYQIIYNYKQNNSLGDVVVIHLGTNNSSISQKLFSKLADLLSDRKLVLFLTAKSDKKQICENVNTTLIQLVNDMPNGRILDWKAISEEYPELFYSDQTHLRPVGAKFYAAAVFSQISQVVTATEATMVDTSVAEKDVQFLLFDHNGRRKPLKKLLLVGDSFMQGYGPTFKSLLSKKGITVIDASKPSTGLVMADNSYWPEKLQQLLDMHSPQLVICSMGANDTQGMRMGDKVLAFGSHEWRNEYGVRINYLLDLAKQKEVEFIWVGLPEMRSPNYDKKVKVVNEVSKMVIDGNGGMFIPTYKILPEDYFSYDENSDSVHAENIMRNRDGIHYSMKGCQKIADTVVQKLSKKICDDALIHIGTSSMGI